MKRFRELIYSILIISLLYELSVGADMQAPGVSTESKDISSENDAGRERDRGNDSDRFCAAATLDYDIQGIELGDLSYGNRGLRYLRDQKLSTGMRLSFKGAGLYARIGVFDLDNPGRNAVSDFMVRGSYFSRVFGAEISYQRAGGYRIGASPFGTAMLWNRIRGGSSMKSESAGLSLFLFLKDLTSLNSDYSYGAAYEQNGRQEKSAGTFIILAGANYQLIRGPVPLVPADTQALCLYRKLFGLTGWRRTGFTIGIGFAGTLVFPRGFFIAPLIGLTFHPSQMEYFTIAGAKKAFRFDTLRGIGRINAGYNGDRFFTGISVNFEAFIVPSYRVRAELWTGDLTAGVFSGFRV